MAWRIANNTSHDMHGRKGNANVNPNYRAHCLEGSGKAKMKKDWQHGK
jgi:hypothetical protein